MKAIEEKLFSKILSVEEKIKYARRHIEDMIEHLRSAKTKDVSKEIRDFREWLNDRELPEDKINELVSEFSDKIKNIKESINMKKTLIESAQRWLGEEVLKETKISEYKMRVVDIDSVFDSMFDFKEYCAKTLGIEGDSWSVKDNHLLFQDGVEDFNVQLIREPIEDEDAIREWTGIRE